MTILIIGSRADNLGDRAIIASMTDQLIKAFPGCALIVESSHPDIVRSVLPEGVHVVPRLFDVTGVRYGHRMRFVPTIMANWRAVGALLRTALSAFRFALRPAETTNPTLQAYRRAHVVVCAGGDFLCEAYGYGYLLRFFEFWMAKRLGKRLIIYSQTIGPFRRPLWPLVRASLGGADLILARDARTAELLARYGVREHVQLTADCAVSLPVRETERVREVREREGIGSDTVLFAPLDRGFSGLGEGEYRSYLSLMARIVLRCRARGLHPFFLAASWNDQKAVRRLNEKLGFAVPWIDATAYDPGEIKAIIGSVRALVSSRMHPVILGIGAGMPTLGFAHLFKMREFMALVGMEDFVLPMIPLDGDRALRAFDRLIDERDALFRRVRERLPGLLAIGARNIEHFKRAV